MPKVRNQQAVRDTKKGQRNFDTYEDLRNCKSGGPHKDKRSRSDREIIEAALDDEDSD